MSCDRSWENMPAGEARTAAYDVWLCCRLRNEGLQWTWMEDWMGKYIGCPAGGAINYAIKSVPWEFAGVHIGTSSQYGKDARAYSEAYGEASGVDSYTFRVFVRNQNNQAPIGDAAVEYLGATKYTKSDGWTDEFRALKDTTITYSIIKSGFENLTRSCYINRDNDECTPYLNPDVGCECGSWINKGCARNNYRKETRTCTPEGCDNQWREVYDPTCAVVEAPPTEYKANILHWWVWTVTEPIEHKENINATAGEQITVAAAMSHNYPSIEKFIWYIVDEDTGDVIANNPKSFEANGGLYHTRLYFKMPSKNLKARIELRRQT